MKTIKVTYGCLMKRLFPLSEKDRFLFCFLDHQVSQCVPSYRGDDGHHCILSSDV